MLLVNTALPCYFSRMSVFKTYDVRGVYPSEIDESLAYRLGRALSLHMGAPRFLVGHDARTHSPALYRSLIAGLLDEGKQVTGIGLVSTPQLHYTQIHRGFEAGVMVTASHNPPQYHGFKVFDAKGGSISYDKGLKDVEPLTARMPAPPSRLADGFQQADSLVEYLDFISSQLQGEKLGLRIVVDASNGSAGRIFQQLAGRLGIQATVLNADPDGSFPHHDPNPLKEESRKQAAEEVLRTKADLGVVLDGDGDRILFIDENGRSIENYFLSCLIAEELIRRTPGCAIVYDLISSRVLPERIAALGGKPVVSKVGYTFLYDAMVARGALFGAETSGHVYFKVTDTYYTESAAYALVLLLRLLARRKERLSTLVEPLRSRYAQSPETNLEVSDKNAALRRIERKYGDGKIERLDGLSVEFPDFWFNVRPSNTEPLLRLRLEARDAATAERRCREITELLKR